MKNMFLNPGDSLFRESVGSEIYVDKSMLIRAVNSLIGTENRFMCVSRARRFGKTMALKMLAAYYSKGADGKVFDGLKITSDESFSEHLGKYNCLIIDLNGFYNNATDKAKMFGRMNQLLKAEFEEQFPGVDFSGRETLADFILAVYGEAGERFVVLVDEYDCLVREQVSDELFGKCLSFLSGLFKDVGVSRAIALAYVTGILPVVKDGFQSKFNNFTEYTMLDPGELAEFTGFTSSETKALCDARGIDFAECRKWYDGYRISAAGGEKAIEIYAPKSVCELARTGKFRSYWTATGSFEALRDCISLDFKGIRADVKRLLAGERIKVNVLKFQNRMDRFASKDDVFTYCIHLGYLSYNCDAGLAEIPNKEVRMEWVNCVEDDSGYGRVMRLVRLSEQLLEDTIAGDAEKVAGVLERAHREVTSSLSYNNEQSLQSAIRLAYFYANEKYTVVSELPSGKGYADVAFIPYRPAADTPALLVELKVDGTAETGLNQIRDKRYFAGLEKYAGNMMLVGISYDRTTKKHSCAIERLSLVAEDG